jgi:hypothetical protein
MPHRAKKAEGFIIEWSPQWLTTDGQGSEGNQSPVAVISSHVERAYQATATLKSLFLVIFRGFPKRDCGRCEQPA